MFLSPCIEVVEGGSAWQLTRMALDAPQEICLRSQAQRLGVHDPSLRMQEWEEPLITSIAGEGLLIHPPLLAFECDRGANPPPLLLSDNCSIFLIQLIVRAAFSNFEDRPHYFGLLLKITAKTSASAERHRKNDDCGRLSLLYGTNVDNLNAAHSVVET
jgi:hypothetical protein